MRRTSDRRVTERFGFPADLPAYYSLGFAAVAILLDYAVGPRVEFPGLFVVPVIYAGWYGGRAWALPVSLLPFAHVGTVMLHGAPDPSVFESIVGAAVRVLVFGLIGWWVADAGRAQRALSHEVELLQGLLPICSYCKKIRDDGGDWQVLEKFIQERSDATFTHGVCEACLEAELAASPNPRRRVS
jgi:hypothetical protein